MDIEVRLLPDASKQNRHCFLIEINKNHTIWYLAKRFSQILDLKHTLEKKHTIKIYDFPKKRLFKSYTNKVLQSRLLIFNRFFQYINTRDHLRLDPIYDKFIRTDIYLDSLKNIQQTDQLERCILHSDHLNLQLINLKDEVDTLQNEIIELGEKLNIINKNIVKYLETNGNTHDRLQTINKNRMSAHEEKLKLLNTLQQMEKLYYLVRKNCCLIKNNNIDCLEKINLYTQQHNTLKSNLIETNKLITNLDDKYVNQYWKIEEYQLINNLVDKKIIPTLQNLNQLL